MHSGITPMVPIVRDELVIVCSAQSLVGHYQELYPNARLGEPKNRAG